MDQKTIFMLSQVSKIYGQQKTAQVEALKKVNLEIKEREFTVIMGPSGSGKTTLLNIMSGLDSPTDGQVFLQNKDLSRLTQNELSNIRRDHIGIIFQSYNLISVLTVQENIEYIMVLQNKKSDLRKKRVQELLQLTGIESTQHRFPKELSGGQQQRVAIARALAAKPNIIIADEPTANLDSATASELLDMMENLNKELGTTFVFSTHDPRIMERAKRLIILHDGKIETDEVR